MKYLTEIFNYFCSWGSHTLDAAIIRQKSGKKLSRMQLEALLAYDEMLLALVTAPAYRSYKQRFHPAVGIAAEQHRNQTVEQKAEE